MRAARCASISSVAAISRLSGQVELALEPGDVGIGDVAAVLAQVRGDAVGAGLRPRKCAARSGSGWRPPRALRMVATWSMLTPRRRGWFEAIMSS